MSQPYVTPSGVHMLSRLADANNEITHVMCSLCFEYVPLADVWTCGHGQKWDDCSPCGEREGCPC